MFSFHRTLLLATALALPGMASAAIVNQNATLVAGQTFTGVSLIGPGDSVRFRFRVLEDLVIHSFSISGTGNNTGDDLRAIRFGRGAVANTAFSTVISDGTASAGTGFLPGRTFAAGTRFRIIFDDGITNDVGLTLSFRAKDVSTVPVPAAGLLFLPLLLVGGLASLRRRLSARRLLA